MASRKKRKSGGSNPGCLILIIGFIALLVVFIVKFPDIKNALESTRFLDILKERATTTTSTTLRPASPESVVSTVPSKVSTPAAPTSTSSSILPTASTVEPSSSSGVVPAVTTASRQSSLFFVKIEEDGVISRREVKRNVPASDSPLTDAISALLAGPSEAEIRTGLVSLIPRGTKLLGISVRGSTAFIDLSDAFMYNHYGIEGYSAQLRQLVYTATAFTSVQDVQILVEGKSKDYLGGEGVYIGKPLSRNSF